jgi:hypothetical protein
MDGGSRPVRIAVVSTPRSGNTWLTALLGRAYAVPTTAAHWLSDGEWAGLPPEVVLQLHWPRGPGFEARLRDLGFGVVTLARHPLDVLVSVLHFAWYEDETASWLLGRGGDERSIRAATPRSRPFVEYATGPRATVLLAVTTSWWGRPGVTSLRYEDLVRDTAAGLAAAFDRFGPPRCPSVEEVIAGCTLDTLQRGSVNNHFWRGRPGLWRELLPAAEADKIAAAVAPVAAALGYDLDPDRFLDAGAADRNWVRYVGGELGDTVRRATAGHQAEVAAWREQSARLEAAAGELRRERDELAGDLARYRSLPLFPLRVAESVQALRDRSPGTARAVGRVATGFARLAAGLLGQWGTDRPGPGG